MSAYRLGGATTAQRAQNFQSTPGGSRDRQLISSPGRRDSVDYSSLGMFANAEYREALSNHEERQPTSPADAVAGLDAAIREALAKTAIGGDQLPREEFEAAIRAATPGLSGELPAGLLDDPLTRVTSGVNFPANNDLSYFGSSDWLEAGKRTGTFFSLHPGLMGEDGLLVSLDGDGRDNADVTMSERLWNGIAREMVRLNEFMGRMIQNGATDEEIIEVARSVGLPTKFLGTDADDLNEGQIYANTETAFGNIYTMLVEHPNRVIADGLENIDGRYSGNLGAAIGRGAVNTLLEAARSLELEIFPDPEQYKVDVNLAIMEYQESIGGDMMGWGSDERSAFNTYLNVARDAAINSREGS